MQDIDCRIVPLSGQLPRENEVAVQNTSCSVANRLVEIVTFYEYGEESGN